ncbi:hypothetical protein BASA50_009730 [Batrachochytrium salamandrivorans]|uniref:Uncharacterized protein n=1 Tax=Batrachochytrium salamandrivorans TaxID=1357716 RepID=A0ABQ8F0Q8_9FUNG|nr:hypothetical protein BASA62_004657 [Batrachochytrium salamandrivorans]KAH6570987.1 hypothetical protein BASA60_007416 [Batrachochytrium salamandrivorans]KAH6590028.1 hypothetical protein BASA50_009730 [Batrachochytrium salamandrivorans]KAH6592308.1 hypothetical protein BASA61_004631 [Batrachochytrium salamandrivorans]KAH9252625.1 hypothetical protein BASA81_009405 [Batrachochytrium salamandrivorans]
MKATVICSIVIALASTSLAISLDGRQNAPEKVSNQDTGLDAKPNAKPNVNPDAVSFKPMPGSSMNIPFGVLPKPNVGSAPLVPDNNAFAPPQETSCSAVDYSTAVQNLQKVIQQQIATISTTSKKISSSKPSDAGDKVFASHQDALLHLRNLNDRLGSESDSFRSPVGCGSFGVEDTVDSFEQVRAQHRLARMIALQRISLLNCMDSDMEKEINYENQQKMIFKLSHLKDITRNVQSAIQDLICRSKSSVDSDVEWLKRDCNEYVAPTLYRRWVGAGYGAGVGAGQGAGVGAGVGAGQGAGVGAGYGAGVGAGYGAGVGAGQGAGYWF